MPSVLIVDDELDIRLLARALIRRAGGLSVAGEATTGEEAIDRWRELHPDVIVMDNRMPGMSGLDAARRILAEAPDQRIILFTAFKDDAVERDAAVLGVRCLSKTQVAELPSAIRAA